MINVLFPHLKKNFPPNITHEVNKSSSNTPQETNTNDIPCPAVLLSIVENEYTEERTRAERLDNKVSALLTVIIALITIYVPIFPFERFIEFYSKPRACFTIPIVFSLFVMMALTSIVIAIISTMKLIDIHKAKNYKAVDFSHFNTNEKLAYKEVARYQIELIDHYQSIILANSAINQEKATALNSQYRNAIIVFILLSFSAIGTLIFINL